SRARAPWRGGRRNDGPPSRAVSPPAPDHGWRRSCGDGAQAAAVARPAAEEPTGRGAASARWPRSWTEQRPAPVPTSKPGGACQATLSCSVFGRGVDGHKKKRRAARIANAMPRARRDDDERPGAGPSLVAVDTHDGLTFDDVDDLIAAMHFLGPGVLTG